ncbi:HAD-like domain-containing protein [Chytriomyces sp. MP71]|nr:HAD-like domain-containing protein [Chytriomyces sp. MP71]
MTSPVTHVLFDMDGTLLDTDNAYTEVNTEICARYGKTFTWEVKSKMMGTTERDAADIFCQAFQLPLTIDEYIAERRRLLADRFARSKPLPGVLRLVRHLKVCGVPICVATSSHRKAFEIKADGNGELFALFDGHVVCGDDVGILKGKPAPDIFLAGARDIGFADTDYSKCLVFEDALVGARAGIAAGAQVVLIPNENLKLDPAVVGKCVKILKTMADFDPTEFGLPAFEQ